LSVQRAVDDQVVKEFTNDAIWELMYFGHGGNAVASEGPGQQRVIPSDRAR
jgi:hypothetical protein